MRTTIGLALALIGSCIMLYGIWSALDAVVGLYQGTMDAPLDTSNDAQATSDAMFRAVIIGAAGALPFLLGTFLLKLSLFKRLTRRNTR